MYKMCSTSALIAENVIKNGTTFAVPLGIIHCQWSVCRVLIEFERQTYQLL